ncbi:CHAT domain-containing protein [Annulohypoxylon bovei var. microspora]|nr:CHAT domain-containing protein [Annulohypoxylon bovei var. microspora]
MQGGSDVDSLAAAVSLLGISDFVNETRERLAEYENGPNTIEACMSGLSAAEKALELAPDGHELRRSRLIEVGFWAHKLFIDHSHDIQDLSRAIDVLDEARRTLTDNDLNRLDIQLAGYHINRSKRTNDVRDVIRANNLFWFVERASSRDQGHIYSEALKGMADCENRLYQLSRIRNPSAAIEAYERVLLQDPDDVSVAIIKNLAQRLQDQWARTAKPKFLDRSIKLLKKYVSLEPENPLAIGELGRALSWRYEERGHSTDLSTSIARGFEALQKAASSEDTNTLNIKVWLSDSLSLRFHRFGDTRDLEQAIQLSRESVETSEESLEQASRLHSHADQLGTRFDTKRDCSDLDMALQCLNTALHLKPNTPTNTWTVNQTSKKIRASLSILHLRRFNATGRIEYLERGIRGIVGSPMIMSHCLQDSIWTLVTRTGVFLARYSRRQTIEDIEQAMEAILTALNSLSRDDDSRPAITGLLSHCYRRRAAEVQSTEDLDRAIDLASSALGQVSRSHKHCYAYLAMVTEALRSRSIMLWENNTSSSKLADSDKAIQYALEARSKVQRGSTNFVHATIALAECFKTRFRQKLNLDDIDQAIEYFKQALGLGEVKADPGENGRNRFVSPEPSDRSQEPSMQKLSFELAVSYSLRAAATASESQRREDEQTASEMFNRCVDTPFCPPRERILAGIRAAEHHSSLRRWTEAVQVWQETLALVPVLCPRSLPQQEQMDVLQDLAGVSRRACSAALNSGLPPSEALKLLESGRGVTTGYLLEVRVNTLDSLQAHRFKEAISELESHRYFVDGMKSLTRVSDLAQWASEFQDYNDADRKLQDVITSIQSNPENKDFLGPPSLDDIKRILGEDIIVEVNASPERCDAFVIDKQHDEVGTIRLETMKFNDVEEWLRNLKASRPLVDLNMLKWLWDTVADPILKYLGLRERTPDSPDSPDSPLPRITWIMTGPLSYFPIHAAGIYDGSPRTVMDHVLSSYSFSLGAFVLGHEWKPKSTFAVPEQRMLLVGMDKTPGLKDLPFAAAEIDRLARIGDGMFHDVFPLIKPRKGVVLDKLSECEIFHFAGHGVSNPLRPLSSGLVLQDGYLTISDMMAHRIEERDPPLLAFLSACLTGANDFEHLIDEGVHLISAFHLIGFQHVIGTLWQVQDETCAKIAESVYAALSEFINTAGLNEDKDDGEVICEGLHSAVLALRNEWMRQQQGTITDKNTDKNPDKNQGSVTGNKRDDEEGVTEICPGRLRGEREAKIRIRTSKTVNLVKADWIPFVHYGILRDPMTGKVELVKKDGAYHNKALLEH